MGMSEESVAVDWSGACEEYETVLLFKQTTVALVPRKLCLFSAREGGHKPKRTDWSWRESGWIKDVWKYSRRSARPYIDPFGSARENNHLPAMSLPHSAMVFTLSGLRREAELKQSLSL
jgi:hypothetical protein